jgi:cell wall-associated protease
MRKLISIFFLFSTQVFAERLIVEMKSPLSNGQINEFKTKYQLQKIEIFAKADSHYFQRTYEVEGVDLQLLAQDENVLHVESITKAEMFSIIPNKKSQFLSADNLFHFQWGLFNQEQTVIKNIKSSKNSKVLGVKDIDIGWAKSIHLYEQNLKKNPLVAVIDMGIDLDHPDLKDQIFINTKECPDGVIVDLDEDKDNNGLKGDCRGWNFAAKSAYEARRPIDDKSHGTHVSGIIAASSNKIGIRGVSDKIKILPLKVTGKVDETDERGQVQPLTDRIAKALIYATNMQADVINFSMGWTKSMDTKYLREAINYALAKGVLIVAAAGNNNNKATILPCSHYDILCVGSLSVDGSFSSFSNFGAEVDVLAPGDEIISTIPLDSIPLQMNQNGYDIKSGTSQATPFVSSIAALLKGVKPELSRDEIISLITRTARLSNDRSQSLYGLVRMDKAFLALNESKIDIKPIFKNLSHLSFDHSQKRFGFLFNVKNYGANANHIVIKLTSMNKDIVLQTETVIESLAKNEVRTIKVDGQILNTRIDQKIKVKVEINTNDIQDEYLHDFILSRDVLKDRNISIKKFQFIDKALPVGIVKDGLIQNIIQTIDDRFTREEPHYIMTKIDKEKKQLEAKILALEGEVIREKAKTIYIKDAVQFLDIERLDLNVDGKDDYVIRTIVCLEKCDNKREAKRHIQYNLYNSELEELFLGKSEWRFYPTIVNVNLKTIKFITTNTILGKVAIPYFIEKGRLPFDQQAQGYFSKLDNREINRLYRLIPIEKDGVIELKTEAVIVSSDIEKLKQSFHHKNYEEENILFALNQTEDDYKNGMAKFLMSVGSGYLQKNYIIFIQNGKIEILPSSISSVLNGYNHEVTKSLDDISLDLDFFVGFLTNSRLNIQFANENLAYLADHSVEVPLSHIATFNEGANAYSFIQTPNYLKLISKEATLEKRINRFSFLPGHIFQDTFYPIKSIVDEKLEPSLYVDATDIATNLISVTTVVDKELVTPLEFSVFIPPICKALNPYPYQKEMNFTLLCLENKEWTVRFLPIKM